MPQPVTHWHRPNPPLLDGSAGVWSRVMNSTADIDAAPLAVKADLNTNSSIAPTTYLYANTTVQPSGCFRLNCAAGQYVVLEVRCTPSRRVPIWEHVLGQPKGGQRVYVWGQAPSQQALHLPCA